MESNSHPNKFRFFLRNKTTSSVVANSMETNHRGNGTCFWMPKFCKHLELSSNPKVFKHWRLDCEDFMYKIQLKANTCRLQTCHAYFTSQRPQRFSSWSNFDVFQSSLIHPSSSPINSDFGQRTPSLATSTNRPALKATGPALLGKRLE